MKEFLTFILMKLRDQRGEVGEETPEEEIADELEEEDVVVIDPDDLEEDDDPEKEPEPEKDPEPEKEPEVDFKAELAKKDEEIKTMNRNFYGLRKKFKAIEAKSADKDVKFTDEQLKEMLDEHQDDPAVMLQIMKHVSAQTSNDAAKAHVDAADISKRKKEMDDYLLASWPDAFVEGSKDQKDIQQAKDFMHLNEHPLGDALAGAMTMFLQMPDMLENAKKEAREGAIKVEDNRKKTIKQNSLESGKAKNAPGQPSNNALAVAKQMGLSKSATKVYLKLRKNANATVEA